MKASHDEALAQQIRKQLDLDVDALDHGTIEKLRVARYRALEHAPAPWYQRQLPALGAALASLLVAVIIIKNWPDTNLDLDLAAIQSGDLEMLSTLEIEELEDPDFYLWLEEQDGAV